MKRTFWASNFALKPKIFFRRPDEDVVFPILGTHYKDQVVSQHTEVWTKVANILADIFKGIFLTENIHILIQNVNEVFVPLDPIELQNVDNLSDFMCEAQK